MSINLNTASRNQLLEEIDRLEAENANYKDALGFNGVHAVQSAIGCTPIMARYIAALSSGKPMRKEQIFSAVYSNRDDDAPEMKIIDVFVCKVRAVVAPFGIGIGTLWGVGYQMDEDSAALIRAIMRGESIAILKQGNRPPVISASRAKAAEIGEQWEIAMRWLRSAADAEGRVAFQSREMAHAAGLKRQVSHLLDQLEQRGRLRVLQRTRGGGAVDARPKWIVELPRSERRRRAA